jgi:hypothetical protein
MPVSAPKPQQPSPVEIQQWQQGARNARQTYDAGSARNTYMKNQATLNNNIANRQMAFNNRQQRQGFDDPYIGRGIFRSGIRGQGLSDLYSMQANNAANQQQQYLSQMAGYGMEDMLAMQARDTTLANLQEQELARRAQLAAEIKGIV